MAKKEEKKIINKNDLLSIFSNREKNKQIEMPNEFWADKDEAEFVTIHKLTAEQRVEIGISSLDEEGQKEDPKKFGTVLVMAAVLGLGLEMDAFDQINGEPEFAMHVGREVLAFSGVDLSGGEKKA